MQITDEAKERIAALIDERGLKLAPIARRIGTSYSTLWNFVHGQTGNFGKIQLLADTLGVTIEWIQSGEEKRHAQKKNPEIDGLKTRQSKDSSTHNNSGAVSLTTVIELALHAAIGNGKKPSEKKLGQVRELLGSIATGSKRPLTESEFIKYAKGFLSAKK